LIKQEQNKKKKNQQVIDLLTEAKDVFRTKSSLFKSRSEYPIVKALNPQPVFPILGGKHAPEWIAQQLTLLEYCLFRGFRPYDLFSKNIAPTSSLSTYANHFKNVRQFFLAEILTQPNQKATVLAIKRAIQVAQFCFLYNNFSSTIEILSALWNSKCTALDKVWDSIDGKTFKIFEDLSEQLSSEDNYKNYRQLIKSTPNPCVPLIGVHASDIRFIDDFNPSEIVDLLNFDKLRLFSEEIRKIQSLQGAEYSFGEDSNFQVRFIENFCHISEMLATVNSQENSGTVSEKMKSIRSHYETIYSDVSAYGKEEINLSLMQLRARDWSVLTTSARREIVEPNEIIYEQEIKTNNPSIAFLKEGCVVYKRNGIILRELKAPLTIGALGILNCIDTSFEVISVTKCVIDFVEERFIVSLLESDCELAMRFFTDLCFQLVIQINETAASVIKSDSERNLRLRSSSRAVDPPQFLNKHLIVKPSNSGSNPSLSLDPKILRDRQFRQLFNFPDDEVLIKEYKASLLGTISAPGTLFVSQRHVSFYVKLFNHKTKMSLEYSEISKISKKKNKITLELVSKKKAIVIRLKDDEDDDAFQLLENIIESLDPQSRPSIVQQPSLNCLESNSYSLEKWREDLLKEKENPLAMTPEDWKLIIGGAKRLVCKKGTTIIAEGNEFQRIFQIVRGKCRTEAIMEVENGLRKTQSLGSITPNQIFGEVSFVQRKGATATVIADSDEVEMFVIEGYFFKRLLQIRPELSGRFLHYICSVLQRRINVHDRFESPEERKVIDLVAEPLHHNIIKHPVLPPKSLDPIIILNGPLQTEEEEELNKSKTATNYCCGTAITTYPLLPVHSDNPNESPKLVREGSPICDQYKCCIYPTRIILGVADGCNWGDPPRNAARAAINAFVRYLSNHQGEIGDLQYAGGLVLRALSMANAEIFKGLDPEADMIGTTTLMGGIILELEIDDDDESKQTIPQYGFVYVSIGDCKAYHWSNITKSFSDITASNRTGTLSASDCGGRLGPHNEGNLPDLRNLELGFYACNPGDCIMIVSDGVHDNLDPAHLGFSPRDLGIEADSWDTVPDFEICEDIKNEYRISLLEKIIFGELDSAAKKRELSESTEPIKEKSKQSIDKNNRKLPSPIEIVDSLTSYCIENCAASASWMQANPRKRLPQDYRLYPGKMDHTTCVCVKIGEQ